MFSLDFRLYPSHDNVDVECIVKVARLRLLGDYHHSTRIAFVEFVMVGYVLRPLGTKSNCTTDC